MSEQPREAVKIMVIRHAEKPTGSVTPFGVTQDGKRENESLTVRGWQRAGALANLFAPYNNFFRDSALAMPQFLYASAPTKRNGSQRPLETLIPLAEKLAIRINTYYPKMEPEKLLEEVFLCPGIVLISWQHDYIPKIANHILGDKKTAPQAWPTDRFDMIWVFDLDRDSAQYSFRQIPQNLLMGDWATPIT